VKVKEKPVGRSRWEAEGRPRVRAVDGGAEVVHDPTCLVKRRWATLGSDPLRINQVVR
jgi:hypothetical protein